MLRINVTLIILFYASIGSYDVFYVGKIRNPLIGAAKGGRRQASPPNLNANNDKTMTKKQSFFQF